MGALRSYELRRHAVERGCEAREFRGVGRCDAVVERVALDPLVQHHVRPLSVRGVAVDVEFVPEEPFAIDFGQVARRVGVAAQGAGASPVAYAEDHGAVARREARLSVGIAAQVDPAQRARESCGVAYREEVLSEGYHGA